ncbi:MAG: acyl--CoA ligase [Gammaproteobacteria bacterium]|nr:acyl--CoA ligase [Gammaproteobacteria bacterium]
MSKILYASEVTTDIHRLDSAWEDPETFAFIPDKTGEVHGMIEAALAELPPPYRTGHFALLTSGSTGRPKLVFGSRDRSSSLARVLHAHQQSEEVNETVVVLPLTYCYSFVNQFLWARQHDRPLVLTKGLTRPDELKSALTAAKDSMICLVGAQVPLLSEYYDGSVFPGVIRVHFAGGRFPSERLEDLRRLFPNALIFNNYGCAEAMPRLTLRPADAAEETSHVGWPLPGIEIDSSPEGELLFRSPYGAVGQADDNGFRVIGPADWVATGDLGRQLDDGHVELLARSSEVFKRHGEKISIPVVLSSVSLAWRGPVSTYREVDGSGEDGYVLVISPHPGDGDVRKILLTLRNKHARSHWPLRIESIDELPFLPNGKIDVQELGEQVDLKQHWRQRI